MRGIHRSSARLGVVRMQCRYGYLVAKGDFDGMSSRIIPLLQRQRCEFLLIQVVHVWHHEETLVTEYDVAKSFSSV